MKRQETLEEARARFLSKVEKDASGCWLWSGYLRSDSGYGGFRFRGSSWKAHRVAYVLFHKDIPEGKIIRHLCHNKRCVNPEHLALGTPKDNSLDCAEEGRRRRNTCKNGHPLSGDNVILNRKTNGRQCKTCYRENARKSRQLGEMRKRGLLPPKVTPSEKDRFLSFVELPKKKTGCWLWKGNVPHHGYGTFRLVRDGFKGKSMRAHRASYILFRGSIPAGMVIRHLCNNKICVNPNHLELGTPADNSRDYKEAGYGRGLYCRSGRHLLKGKNLYTDSDGGRHCHTCENERMRTPEGAYKQRLNRWKRLGKADAEQRASISHYRDKRTHCKQGHPFTEENTYETPDGERSCRTCVRLRQQTPEQKQRKKIWYLMDRYGITQSQAKELIESNPSGRMNKKRVAEALLAKRGLKKDAK